MTTEEALGEFLVEQKVANKSDTREDWYGGFWFFTTILGVKIPVFPRFGFRRGLPAHDTHHMLNGYRTHWIGECETAAWELASGGCGHHLAYWIDRLLFLAIALLTAPAQTLRAWKRGWGQRNLYRLEPDRLLAMDIDEVRRYVAREAPSGSLSD
jgi:hypothetical protein